MTVYKQTIRNISFFLVAFLALCPYARPSAAEEKDDEQTYSISLVQTAEVGKEIISVGDKKVLTEAYTVEKGDHIWQIFRERGLLKKRNLIQLLSMFRRLNKSLTNLDLIYPDQQIVIPLIITPIGVQPKFARKAPVASAPPDLPKDLKLENYTIKPGDTLVKVVKNRYRIPDKDLYDQYLRWVKGLNPYIEDLDTVYPGQVVRLPIWTPQVVRVSIRPTVSLRPQDRTGEKGYAALSNKLSHIFSQMGEEWVQTGEHFIPLRSGGHIDLKADAYPIINLYNGYKVIVDLQNNLPEKMSRLIESSWENYRIVHLNRGDELRAAFDKILSACRYAKIYKSGEPFELGGDIPLRITGDWIIQPTAGPEGEREKMVIVNLIDDSIPKTPEAIKNFLLTQGIKVIDYPPGGETTQPPTNRMEILRAGNDVSSLIEMLLKLTGESFSSGVEIPVYKGGTKHFNLIIKADFLLNLKGKDSVIDLTGLAPDVVGLLQDHEFSVLSLANEKDPAVILSKTLDFLGVKFDSKPHDFFATGRSEDRNIRLTIPGIIFRDNHGQSIFATHLRIPGEIGTFLSQHGYKVLSLALS